MFEEGAFASLFSTELLLSSFDHYTRMISSSEIRSLILTNSFPKQIHHTLTHSHSLALTRTHTLSHSLTPTLANSHIQVASGFCLFNNVAIAAEHLVGTGRRVAIIDVDYHHGNGTQVRRGCI